MVIFDSANSNTHFNKFTRTTGPLYGSFSIHVATTVIMYAFQFIILSRVDLQLSSSLSIASKVPDMIGVYQLDSFEL